MLLMPVTGSFSGIYWNTHKASLAHAQPYRILSGQHHNFTPVKPKGFPEPAFFKDGILYTWGYILHAYTIESAQWPEF